MNKSVIGIQARSNSTRLPGKIYKTIGHKSILKHVYDTCSKVAPDTFYAVILCHSKDTRLIDYVVENQMNHYIAKVREEDLLGRYYACIQELDAPSIIRVTSDCPLISSKWLTRMCDLMPKYDYITNTMPRTVIDGDDVQGISQAGFAWYVDQIKSEEHLFSRLEYDLEFRKSFISCGFSYKSEVSKDKMILNPFLDENKLSIDNEKDLERVRRYYESTTAC